MPPRGLTYGPTKEEPWSSTTSPSSVPDIAEAIAWQQRTIPGTTVLHQDDTWGLVESGGAKLAFVLA